MEAREAAEREFGEERASTAVEHNKLVAQMTDLVSSCGAQAVKMMRAVKAVEGADFDIATPEDLALMGVLQIISSVCEATGSVTPGVARLYHAVQGDLHSESRLRVADCVVQIERTRRRHMAVSVPPMVILLDAYDKAQVTKLAPRAADTVGQGDIHDD